LNIDKLLDNVLTRAIEVSGAQGGLLFIYEDNSNTLKLKSWKNVIGKSIPDYSGSIVDNVFNSGESFLSLDNGMDNKFISSGISIEHGIKSVLCTPIKRGERTIGVCYLDNKLSSGVFTEETRELMNIFMVQVAICIENAKLVENLETLVNVRTLELEKERNILKARNEAIENDLSLAKNIQINLLPKIHMSDISAIYKSMDKVGGDFYDFIRYENKDLTGIFLSDVSGHGVPAALIMSMLKSILLQIAASISDPSILLENLNSNIINLSSGNFITAFYGIYNRKKDTFLRERRA
jgi:hypothetical protein